ncbi:MAG: o-succinylbenzoate synthase [Opitutaceae bacterium]|nr:o-succinylbenzoate synthase [Opitutaceae bacterium]
MDVSSPRLDFSFKAYRRPFRVPVRTSRGLWEMREGIVVRVADDDGRVGFGEIAPISWFKTETFVGALAWCESLGPEVTEARLLDPGKGLPCCAAAAAAAVESMRADDESGSTPVDAKRVPVAALLPSGWAALDAVERAGELGFTVFKVKIGTGDVQAEQGLVERLVGRLPDRGKLRLDANGGLDARTAARWLAAAEDWPVEFIEQPLPADARDDLSQLAADHRVPVALDESVLTADDIKRWRDRGWPGLFVIKPALSGRTADLVAEIAPDPGSFVFSSALETDIGLGAGVGLALRCGVSRALGYGTGAFFHDDQLGGSIAGPWFGAPELEGINPAAVWKRL